MNALENHRLEMIRFTHLLEKETKDDKTPELAKHKDRILNSIVRFRDILHKKEGEAYREFTQHPDAVDFVLAMAQHFKGRKALECQVDVVYGWALLMEVDFAIGKLNHPKIKKVIHLNLDYQFMSDTIKEELQKRLVK